MTFNLLGRVTHSATAESIGKANAQCQERQSGWFVRDFELEGRLTTKMAYQLSTGGAKLPCHAAHVSLCCLCGVAVQTLPCEGHDKSAGNACQEAKKHGTGQNKLAHEFLSAEMMRLTCSRPEAAGRPHHPGTAANQYQRGRYLHASAPDLGSRHDSHDAP